SVRARSATAGSSTAVTARPGRARPPAIPSACPGTPPASGSARRSAARAAHVSRPPCPRPDVLPPGRQLVDVLAAGHVGMVLHRPAGVRRVGQHALALAGEADRLQVE